jgi:hypothetical protein
MENYAKKERRGGRKEGNEAIFLIVIQVMKFLQC